MDSRVSVYALASLIVEIPSSLHISKLAYEDLTSEKSSDPESFAPWYTMITLGGPWSIPCGQCLDPTLGKFPLLYGPHLIMCS